MKYNDFASKYNTDPTFILGLKYAFYCKLYDEFPTPEAASYLTALFNANTNNSYPDVTNPITMIAILSEIDSLKLDSKNDAYNKLILNHIAVYRCINKLSLHNKELSDAEKTHQLQILYSKTSNGYISHAGINNLKVNRYISDEAVLFSSRNPDGCLKNSFNSANDHLTAVQKLEQYTQKTFISALKITIEDSTTWKGFRLFGGYTITTTSGETISVPTNAAKLYALCLEADKNPDQTTSIYQRITMLSANAASSYSFFRSKETQTFYDQAQLGVTFKLN